MAKSRVEKNKKLYDKLEKDEFELEDITVSKKETEKKVINDDFFELEDLSDIKKDLEVTETEKKQEVVLVQETKKNEIVVKEKQKVKVEVEDDFVVEQPISYNEKLFAEEALRAKLEKQQELKDKKRGYKKTPNTPEYTPEMMQKNISQHTGVDIRKEANIRVKRENSGLSIVLLVFLLIAVIAGGTLLLYIIW